MTLQAGEKYQLAVMAVVYNEKTLFCTHVEKMNSVKKRNFLY